MRLHPSHALDAFHHLSGDFRAPKLFDELVVINTLPIGAFDVPRRDDLFTARRARRRGVGAINRLRAHASCDAFDAFDRGRAAGYVVRRRTVPAIAIAAHAQTVHRHIARRRRTRTARRKGCASLTPSNARERSRSVCVRASFNRRHEGAPRSSGVE